jgi:hypothetical protein
MGRETKIDFIYHSSNSTNDYSALSIILFSFVSAPFYYFHENVEQLKGLSKKKEEKELESK